MNSIKVEIVNNKTLKTEPTHVLSSFLNSVNYIIPLSEDEYYEAIDLMKTFVLFNAIKEGDSITFVNKLTGSSCKRVVHKVETTEFILKSGSKESVIKEYKAFWR